MAVFQQITSHSIKDIIADIFHFDTTYTVLFLESCHLLKMESWDHVLQREKHKQSEVQTVWNKAPH